MLAPSDTLGAKMFQFWMTKGLLFICWFISSCNYRHQEECVSIRIDAGPDH